MPGISKTCISLINRIFCLLFLLMGGLWLQGCASNVAISAKDRAALHTASVIHVVHYEPSTFNLMTPKTAGGTGLIFGMVSDATDSTTLPSGGELMKAFSLTPAVTALEQDLLASLKSEGGLSNLQVDSQPLKLPLPDKTSIYHSKFSSGLVLELAADYGANYELMHWKTYNFGIFGRARLIRVADGKVLWKDTCNVSGHSDDSLVMGVSQFEANNGARLKKLTLLSAEKCSHILADKLLGKTGG